MNYRDALRIGRDRADQAAEIIRRWANVAAYPVCAVRPTQGDGDSAHGWDPVGRQSFKEIVRDDGAFGLGDFHLLVVDEQGSAKACSKERFALAKAVELATRVPLPVAMPGRGELWRELEARHDRAAAGTKALLPDA